MRSADLWHEAAGEGPAVVLVHAGICDARMWDEVVPLLTPDHRVVRYDMRGFGRSGPATAPYSPAADLVGVLDANGVQEALLCGVSFGGGVVLETALLHPERVTGLAVVCTAVDWSDVPDDLSRRIEEADEAGEAGDLDRAVELELRIWVDGEGRREPVDPALRERVREMNERAWELSALSTGETQWVEPPTEERLGEIGAPALVVAGEHDVAFVRDQCSWIADELRDARLVEMDGVAHLPPLERPAELAALLRTVA